MSYSQKPSHFKLITGILIVILLNMPCLVAGQTVIGQPSVKAYSSSIHRFVGDITQDHRGIIYFVSRPGIFTYDGVRFDQVLFDVNSLNGIDRDSNGTIYAVGANMFLKSQIDSIGQVKFVNLLDRLKDAQLLRGSLYPTKKKMYVRSRTGIFEYDILTDSLTHYPGTFLYGFVKDDYLWTVRNDGEELVVLKNGQFFRAPFTDSLIAKKVPIKTMSLSFTGNERILNLPSGLFAYSGVNARLRPMNDIGEFRQSLSTAISINKRLHFVGSTLKGGLIIDSLGNQKQVITTASGLITNSVIGSYVDKESNLWLGLFGFKKNQLVKTEHGSDLLQWPIPGTPLDMKKYKDKVYFSTTQNLYVIDPTSNEMKPIFQGDHRVESIVNFRIGEEQHLLAALTPDNKIFEVDEKGNFKVIFEAPAITWLHQSRSNPNRLYLVNNFQVSCLIYSKGKWQQHGLKVDFPCLELAEDMDGSIWMTDPSRRRLLHAFPNDKSDIFKVAKIVSYSEKDSLPKGFIWPYLVGDSQLLFRSDIGLLQFNPTSNKFEKWNSFGKKIHSLGTFRSIYKNPNDGSYYLQKVQSEGEELLQVKPTINGDTLIVSHPFKRIYQYVGIVGDRAFLADGKSVWFAGQGEYLVRYTASEDIKTYSSPFHCFIRKVNLNDSVLYGGYFSGKELSRLKPKLLYDSGHLTIQFAAPYYDFEDQTLYSYKMEGLDKTWSPWQRTTEKEYQNFDEGNYTFLVKAKNVYGQESDVASFSFQVLPPWHRTWWAYVTYILLFGLLVMVLVRWRTRSLHRKKRKLEEVVEEKTQELKNTNQQLVITNQELETSQEELRQSNDELHATNEYLKKTQRQLVESEKMASLGQLTAGIAHEINNPINFISGGVQAINTVTQEFLESKEHTPEKLKSTLRDIQDLMASINNGVNRTVGIIASLKTFTSPSEVINTYIDVKECIENSIVLLRRKLQDHEIQLTINYDHKAQVLANTSQLSQVMINLLDNAIHALRDVNGPRRIEVKTYEQGRELLIQVKDNGMGIDEGDTVHIFEPFFTTKEVGSGVGLGLSISYSIIERHKGKITFVSTLRKGTEFTVSLPLPN